MEVTSARTSGEACITRTSGDEDERRGGGGQHQACRGQGCRRGGGDDGRGCEEVLDRGLIEAEYEGCNAK